MHDHNNKRSLIATLKDKLRFLFSITGKKYRLEPFVKLQDNHDTTSAWKEAERTGLVANN